MPIICNVEKIRSCMHLEVVNEMLKTRCQMLVLMLMTMMPVPELYESVPGPAYDNHAPSNMCAGLEARLLATLSAKL